MLRSRRQSIAAQPVIATQANPRLRQSLSKQLSTASACDVERLSWLYWLLRTRLPKKTLMQGADDDGVVLMAAAAISACPCARLYLADQPLQLRGRSILSEAGLDWVGRCVSAIAAPGSDARFDAAVIQGAGWADAVRKITPHLTAGALIIGLDDALSSARTSDACAQLLRDEPGLESLMLSPAAMPVNTMIWRGH